MFRLNSLDSSGFAGKAWYSARGARGVGARQGSMSGLIWRGGKLGSATAVLRVDC
jgi:hypothetical protein